MTIAVLTAAVALAAAVGLPGLAAEDWWRAPWIRPNESAPLQSAAAPTPPTGAEQQQAALLRAAIQAHKPAVVRSLLLANPALNHRGITDYNNGTPLHCAIGAGDLLVIEAVLQNGGDPNEAFSPPDTSLLALALGRHRVDEAELLLQYGADANVLIEYESKPLLKSEIETGSLAGADLLLRHGAYLTDPPGYTETPLRFSALAGQSVALTRLIGLRGAPWPADVRRTANGWHYAAVGPSSSVTAQLALVPPALYDVNGLDDRGLTPLMVYCFPGQASYVDGVRSNVERKPRGVDGYEILRAHGADLRQISPDGLTVLHCAAAGSDVAMVRLCLNAGCDINAMDHAGDTPLDAALQTRNCVVIPELLAQGATFHPRDADHPPPLFWLSSLGNYDVTQSRFGNWQMAPSDAELDRAMALLIQGGCDPNELLSNGQTPLFWAVIWGHRAALESLLKHGADPNAGPGSWELLAYGASRDPELLTLLLAHGADARRRDKQGLTVLETILTQPQVWNLDRLSDWLDHSDTKTVYQLLYAAQQRPVNLGIAFLWCLVALGLALSIQRWVRLRSAGVEGARAEAMLDDISARADWKELLLKFQQAQAFQRRVWLHRPWILIGVAGWLFGVAMLWEDPLLHLFIRTNTEWYLGIFSGGFLVSCALQFSRRSGLRIFGASLGIVVLIVSTFYASAADYIIFAHAQVYDIAGLFGMMVLATLVAAWRFHRTLKAEMALRKVKLPPELQLHRRATAEDLEIEPPRGWDQGGGGNDSP